MAPKIQFFVTNFFNFLMSNPFLKNFTPGEFRDLSKSGLENMLCKKSTPGKSEQKFGVIGI